MRLIGDLILKQAGSVYSPTVPRLTESGTFRYSVLQLGGTTTGSIVADVEHRTMIDDNWVSAGSFLNAATTGLKTKSISSGLRDLARIKMTLNTGSADAWARVIVLDPVWTSASAVIETQPPSYSDGGRHVVYKCYGFWNI